MVFFLKITTLSAVDSPSSLDYGGYVLFLNLSSLRVVDLRRNLDYRGNGVFLNLTSLSGVDSLLSFAASSDIGRKLLLDFMSFNTFNMIILLFA